jgi:hypothetical protein
MYTVVADVHNVILMLNKRLLHNCRHILIAQCCFCDFIIIILSRFTACLWQLQGVPGGKVNILGEYTISHYK